MRARRQYRELIRWFVRTRWALEDVGWEIQEAALPAFEKLAEVLNELVRRRRLIRRLRLSARGSREVLVHELRQRAGLDLEEL